MPEPRTSDSKQRILDAALHLFARKGYSATGVRELAREAGVNIAMVNYYFESKAGILKTLLDVYFDRLQAISEEVLSGQGSSEQKIRLYIRQMATFFLENPELVKVVFGALPFEIPEISQFKAERAKRIIPLFMKELLPALEREIGRPVQIEIMGPMVLGMLVFPFLLESVLERVFGAPMEEAFYARYTETIMEILFHGLTGQAPSPTIPCEEVP